MGGRRAVHNSARPAYGVARFLQQHGNRIVPVHPKAETVHGAGYRTLSDIPMYRPGCAHHAT
jgi:hypothetical protein